MEHDAHITVYSFRVFDSALGAMQLSKYKAPRDTIVNDFAGEVLEGTEQAVSPGELDAQGRYRRVATGWGELA